MLRQRIENAIEQFNTTADGKVGGCAATIDGDMSVAIRADEPFPAASSIEMFTAAISLCVYDASAARCEYKEKIYGLG